ncbi:MAG: phosphopyruvate hydratase [Candidatus Kerfeldbacteria bacterium]
MKTATIRHIAAQEILDSRGEPTIRTTVELKNGMRASATVPAGVSTGSHEAHEKRDGGVRYGGKGVLRAVRNVTTVISKMLSGVPIGDQRGIDDRLIALDPKPHRDRIGANALLGVSLACARAGSIASETPLYVYLREQFSFPKPSTFPKPMCNILNGGRHSDNGISFQEYLVIADGRTIREQLERVWRVIRAVKSELVTRGDRTLVGDEGGFAPLLSSNEEGLRLLTKAIRRAGLRIGKDVSLALDIAASEWYSASRSSYFMKPEKKAYSGTALARYYQRLATKYNLRSIEDPFAEDDWDNWTLLTEKLGRSLLLIGDDLFVTQKSRLAQGVHVHAANAILIKPNQVGTLTETMETIQKARASHYTYVISHRSGETCDDFIADLAVAVGSPFLKAGSLARGERLAKYNRLLVIAEEIGIL